MVLMLVTSFLIRIKLNQFCDYIVKIKEPLFEKYIDKFEVNEFVLSIDIMTFQIKYDECFSAKKKFIIPLQILYFIRNILLLLFFFDVY